MGEHRLATLRQWCAGALRPLSQDGACMGFQPFDRPNAAALPSVRPHNASDSSGGAWPPRSRAITYREAGVNSPLLTILTRLPGGAEYDIEREVFVGSCPAHENANGDLEVALTQTGVAELRCAVGCHHSRILNALHLGEHDLHPPPPQTPPPRTPERLYNQEVETELLASILTGSWGQGQPVELEMARGLVTPADLGAPHHAEIYGAIIDLAGNGLVADPSSVRDLLLRRGQAAAAEIIDGEFLSHGLSWGLNAQGGIQTILQYSRRRAVATQLHSYSMAVLDGVVTPESAAARVIATCEKLLASGTSAERVRLDAVLADPEVMRPPAAVIPRIAWQGRSTLLAAREKAGKSTLLGAATAQVSRGGLFLGYAVPPGDVVYVALEDSLGDVGRRLVHFGANPQRIHIATRIDGGSAEAREAVLRRHVREVRPSLVVVDTLLAYGMGIVGDENDAAGMQPLVQGLTRIAHEEGPAVVLVHHNNRGGEYRGSTAIGGAVDCILEMEPRTPKDPTGDPVRDIRVRGRIPDARGFSVTYDSGQARYSLL